MPPEGAGQTPTADTRSDEDATKAVLAATTRPRASPGECERRRCHTCASDAQGIAQSALEDAWESVTWGTGTAGPPTARFCALRVRPTKGRGDRWLLCERSATDERKYYLLHLLETATLVDLVALARSRWPIEQQSRELKDDLGLDHFEGRTYQGGRTMLS